MLALERLLFAREDAVGAAKRRKAEIDRLKALPREQQEAYQALKADERIIEQGIDIERDPEAQVTALARVLAHKFQSAVEAGELDEPTSYLLTKAQRTLAKLSDVPVACKKGCSHCCNIWVSASVPEIFYLAKLLRGQASGREMAVREAHAATEPYTHEQRPYHPFPCGFLENNECSIYEHRPVACRLASSGDAEICARSYNNITDENIPTSVAYLMAREGVSLSLLVALQKAGLPQEQYELNAALVTALDTDDAERRWLAGEDIFAGVKQDPGGLKDLPEVTHLYKKAFPA